MQNTSVIIFTDGASRGNPGPGGWGAVIIDGDMVKELGDSEAHTTNNRMELTAAIRALEQTQDAKNNISIFSDSSYLINGITQWVHGWERKGWKTADRKPVLNRDLWEQLLRYSTIYRTIDWKLVEGHAGVPGNMRCDEIAQMFADATPMDADKIKLYHGPLSEYPIRNVLDVAHDSEAVERKKTGRAHSNAKAYSYVSLVDGAVQTHKTWAECEARVKGKQAKYKKVFSAEEEKTLHDGWSKEKE